MKRWIQLGVLLLLPLMANAQAVRFSGNVYTLNSSAPLPGALYPVLANTSATVAICTYSSATCAATVTTYTDATEATACATTAQLTPPASGACTANVNADGTFGGWIAPGTYQYVITTRGKTLGPFPFTVGGTGGGGSGTVTSFAAPSGSWPTWLVPTVTNPTTTPSLAVAASPIPNAALANASTTVNGQTCTLGSTCTITTSFPSGTANQLLYYASSGTTLTPLTLGTNLSITSGTLNAANPTFSAIQSGTNLAAAMLVGTGASLNYTGSGTINSSSVGGVALSGLCQTSGAGCPSSGSTAFSAITSGTNTAATMTVGTGASLVPSGTGAIQATNIASTIVAGTNITITGSGTVASPYSIAASGSVGTTFNSISTGTNTTATMTVGTGATITYSGSGVVNASTLGGVALSGLCQTGGTGCPQLPITITPVSHQWLNSYTSTTGLFTQTQPAFSDLSGQASLTQLPTLSANTVLGAVTATTPSGLAMPSCSTGASALTWTTGTGFGSDNIAGITLQTNGVNNTSQTALNFITSTVNTTGLTVTPSNPATGNEKFEIAGNINNANLATQTANTVLGALTATTPSGLAMPSCSTGSSALTWTSGTGFGCNTISGSGTVNSGTANHIAWYAATGTAVSSDANLDDGATTAGTLTYAGTGGITASAGPLTSAPASGKAGILSLASNTTNPTLTAGDFSLLGAPSASVTAFAWQVPTATNASAGVLHVAANVSGVSALSVSTVANADLANSSVTYNGQTVALGATGNVNSGATAHTVAVNEGNGNAIAGVGPGTAKQILTSGGSGADPTYIDFPMNYIIPAANCNNVTAGASWSLPASAAPTAACRTGTNTNYGVLQYAASKTAQFQLNLPADYNSSGTVYALIQFTQGANTTSGQTIIMQMATECYTTTDDPSFNTAQSFATATTVTTANTPYDETLSSVTMTGCTAGHPLNVKILRSGSDTATTAPNVAYVSLTIPRLLTNQAN